MRAQFVVGQRHASRHGDPDVHVASPDVIVLDRHFRDVIDSEWAKGDPGLRPLVLGSGTAFTMIADDCVADDLDVLRIAARRVGCCLEIGDQRDASIAKPAAFAVLLPNDIVPDHDAAPAALNRVAHSTIVDVTLLNQDVRRVMMAVAPTNAAAAYAVDHKVADSDVSRAVEGNRELLGIAVAAPGDLEILKNDVAAGLRRIDDAAISQNRLRGGAGPHDSRPTVADQLCVTPHRQRCIDPVGTVELDDASPIQSRL